METRSDNLAKVPVASKSKTVKKEAGLKKKVVAASLERQLITGNRKKEIPQLTPLHRLQRFKAIRDRNLKSKGFKTSLENKLKKMEEVTSPVGVEQKKVKEETVTTTKVEVIEKLVVKESFEERKVSDSNGLDKLDKVEGRLDGEFSLENGHKDKEASSKEMNEDAQTVTAERNQELIGAKEDSESNIIDVTTIDNNVESHSVFEDEHKVYVENMAESDAVSSVSSHQAVTNSTPGPTDDEEEVEVIESKPQHKEINPKENPDSCKPEQKQSFAGNIFAPKTVTDPSNRCFSSSSIASSYKTSYSNVSRIYGRRPVRHLSASRKRKLEEDSVNNHDYKRTSSPSVPSPRWRFIPSSMNFWTPRTTPFAFPTATPVHSLNDSLAVNVDDDTIRSSMEDTDLFSDADEFAPQPSKKSRWGCAIM